jgi:hypothetical protein
MVRSVIWIGDHRYGHFRDQRVVFEFFELLGTLRYLLCTVVFPSVSHADGSPTMFNELKPPNLMIPNFP